MDLLHHAFEAQVRRTPEAIALAVGIGRMTYAELNARANRLAHVLRSAGVGPETLVGVCLPRDHTLIPALLAVLKSGGAYVPLDPAFPAQRLAFIAEDAQLRHVITDDPARWPGVQAIDPDAGDDDSDPVYIGQPDNTAYLIYTSGTTGRPKGAVTEHGSVMNLLRWMRATYSDEELAGSLCAASICHDFSTVETFPALTTGGTVVLVKDMLDFPHNPARDLVTMISGVPSAVAAMLHEPLPPNVRTFSLGGELVPRALTELLYSHPQVRRVLHMYGPTECTTYSTMYEVPRSGSGLLPLGGPVAGAQLSLRDSAGNEVPEGSVGELWIGGPVVVRGYLSRPELTAEKFVSLPDGGRAYRSGDLARIEDGQLYFAGRADDQVKVRGYRVELGEVEIALAEHPSVRNAVVRAEGETLLGYVETDDATLTEQALRQRLSEQLPGYMVPSRIAVLDRIPLSPVGKADRNALAATIFPEHEAEPDSRNETEAGLAEIFAAAVGRSRVGRDDDFLALGGHSLAAARVCAEIRHRFGVLVTLAEFHSGPTVARVAALIGERQPAPSSAIVRHADRDTFPLTDMQRMFWMTSRLSDSPDATLTAARLRLTGVPGEAAVRAALDTIADRHDVLRSTIIGSDDEPMLRVAPHRTEDGPWRAEVVQTEPGVVDLTFYAHHYAFDGWSIGLLMEELAAHLAGEALPPLELQLGDVALHTEPSHPSDVEYWRERLRGVTAPHDLPQTGRREGRPGRYRRDLPDDLLTRATAIGTTPFATFLAALGILVAGHTGRDDVLLGAPFVQRDRATERLIGPLMGNLPVRLAVSAARTFREQALAAGQEVIAGLSHTRTTFAEMTEQVRHQRGKPVLPILLSMQPDSAPVQACAGDVQVELLGELSGGGGPEVLSVFFNRTVTGPELIIEYPDGQFGAESAEAFAASLLRILESGLSDPDLTVGAIALVGEEQQRELLAAGCPAALAEPSHVVTEFLAQARRSPEALAVTAPDGELTYGELDELSARIASGLLRQGVLPGEVVAVELERCRLLLPALLGVMRAGAAYLPLDPEHPQARREYQITDGAARIVLSGETIEGLATEERQELPPPAPGLAYLLYTSGSTGMPKGVDVEHVSLGTNLVAMQAVFGATPQDAVLSVSPTSFDVAHLGMWLPLSTGGRCVLIDTATAADGHAMAKRLAETGVTALFAPPTSLRMLQAADWPGEPRMRVMSAGEALDPVLAREIGSRVAELWNGYGPTEAAIITTMHLVSPGDASSVPIGRPLPGYRVYVADETGRLVPPGAVGELWIAGPAVARGYRHRPELTEQAFRDDPFGSGPAYRTGDLVRWRADRRLEYLGRRDHQVKVRGFRVEPGEIETVLRDHPGIADVVVTARGAVGETHLVGYVVWRTGAGPEALGPFLRRRLPDYMVPHRWVTMESLPLNHNGKVDRAALPEPADDQAVEQTPVSTQMEAFVAEIWAAVLGRESLYASSDFFGLGGHSFAATRVAGRIWTALGCRVPVQALFDHPVLADFAVEVERIALTQLSREQS